MKIIKYSFLLLIVAFVISACSKKPDVEFTSTVNMSGEWFVQYFDEASPNVIAHDFDDMLTYNTSDPSSGQVWVQESHYWPFKSKLPVDYANRAFTAIDNAPNLSIANKTVKIYEGKVLPGAGHSRSGNAVDSIYLRVEFSDDAGVIYQIRGHQRTGFFEDEY